MTAPIVLPNPCPRTTTDHAEALLGSQRYLLGDRLTGPDLRLFHALVRYDEVYHVRARMHACRQNV